MPEPLFGPTISTASAVLFIIIVFMMICFGVAEYRGKKVNGKKKYACLICTLYVFMILVDLYKIYVDNLDVALFDYDYWGDFAVQIRLVLTNPGHVILFYNGTSIGPLQEYWHAITPLYAVGVALFSFVFNEPAVPMQFSMLYFGLVCTTITLYVTFRICKDFLKFDDARAFRVVSIVLATPDILYFAMDPATTSMFIMAISVGIYFTLKLLADPSMKNYVSLAIANIFLLYTHNIDWIVLILPITSIVLLKIVRVPLPPKSGSTARMLVNTFIWSIFLPVIAYAAYIIPLGLMGTLLLNFWHLKTFEPYQAPLPQYLSTLFTYLTFLIALGAFGIIRVLGTLRRSSNSDRQETPSEDSALVLVQHVQQTGVLAEENKIPYLVLILMLVEFLLFRAILGGSLFIAYWGPIAIPLSIFSVVGMDLQARVHPELVETFYILQIQQFVTLIL